MSRAQLSTTTSQQQKTTYNYTHEHLSLHLSVIRAAMRTRMDRDAFDELSCQPSLCRGYILEMSGDGIKWGT